MTTTRDHRTLHIDRSGPFWDDVYRSILEPSFPDDELVAPESIAEGLDRGDAHVVVALDAAVPVAAAVAEWLSDSRVVLLSYLAVAPGRRGDGVGGPLLDEALRTWRGRFAPRLVVGEAEHPDVHVGGEDHGDPASRLRFYARNGGRAVDVPYFQPALRPGTRRRYGMILFAFDEGDAVPAQVVRRFLDEHLTRTEGAVTDDAATVDLFAATDGDEIALLDLQGDGLPLSRPPAP